MAEDDDYASEVVRRIFSVAAAEAAESDLLDEVRVMDSRRSELTASLGTTAKESDSLRTATSSAIVEINRLAREHDTNAREHAALRLEFDGQQKNSDSATTSSSQRREACFDDHIFEDDPASLQRLIETKTRLAELTEKRDRAILDRKRLEDEICQAKLGIANYLMAIDDDESELAELQYSNHPSPQSAAMRPWSTSSGPPTSPPLAPLLKPVRTQGPPSGLLATTTSSEEGQLGLEKERREDPPES